jgi:N-acetylglucosaminyldiphosphoundecaprenol N-acetyl-beta-D-mannosaminyltransferase
VEIILQAIKPETFFTGFPAQKVFFYGDFNVLNYLYRESVSLPENFVVYPDSTATFMMLKWTQKLSISKIISTDLQESILKKAILLKKKIFFFGDYDSVLKKLQKKLVDEYDYECGSYRGYDFDSEEVIKEINNYRPEILFIGIGVERQEQWILNNYRRLNVRIIITVGGWFRYLSGEKKRAAYWIRSLNLEWLYKLITENRRIWRRYFSGVPLFAYRVVTNKLILKFRDEDIVV